MESCGKVRSPAKLVVTNLFDFSALPMLQVWSADSLSSSHMIRARSKTGYYFQHEHSQELPCSFSQIVIPEKHSAASPEDADTARGGSIITTLGHDRIC